MFTNINFLLDVSVKEQKQTSFSAAEKKDKAKKSRF